MRGLTKINSSQFTADNDEFWSKHTCELGFNCLQKFWSELSPQARRDLLKVDKQSIFEQARKNIYCSRCNGLLLECFMQIVTYRNSSQTEETGGILFGRRHGDLKIQNEGLTNLTSGCDDNNCDPAAHPWGGLTPAKDGTLTVLSTYMDSKSLEGLQHVFDSACAREKERKLLYPNACGGGGRGWISQGMTGYGRVRGTRETCALHTAKISCDTLEDFWTSLGDEYRQSLLRMKEEDFVTRLMYRFDSKRFCRDCRKNVIREFKELKELKRMRRKPHCTRTFCAADSVFQYEVSNDAIRADWCQTFTDASETYHHFEWAVGSGEGKSDILEFENVGLNKCVEVDGLDLGGLNACHLTLRAWKQDGKCTEISVKAHAMKGRECIHNRLVFGDGFVSISKGESIRRFFEHAEEAEEEDEDDDDVIDKDGNEPDEECSRPQKHAKSPELAREFLLDAATVIFKEQVEKAFREGNARQNAHRVFVCLVLKLLERRIKVACKEIFTLKIQAKLLEEEDKEKKEEEERKERRRMKEREKKQKRKGKGRHKGKEWINDKDVDSSNSVNPPPKVSKNEQSSIQDEEDITANGKESSYQLTIGRPSSPNMQDLEISSDRYSSLESRDHSDRYHSVVTDSGEYSSAQDKFDYANSEHPECGNKFCNSDSLDSVPKWSRSGRHGYANVTGGVHSVSKGLSRQFKGHPRNFPAKHSISCSCNYTIHYEVTGESKLPTVKIGLEDGEELKSNSTSGKITQFYNGSKTCQSDGNYASQIRSHGKEISGNNCVRDLIHTKLICEPLDLQKKYPRRVSESDIELLALSMKEGGTETSEVQSQSTDIKFGENVGVHISKTPSVKNISVCDMTKIKENDNSNSKLKNSGLLRELLEKEVNLSLKASSLNDCCDAAVGSDSNSENSFSDLSERGSSNLTSTNTRSLETTNSSDSDESSQLSENKEEAPSFKDSNLPGYRYSEMEETSVLKFAGACKSDTLCSIPYENGWFDHQFNSPAKGTFTSVHGSPYLSSELQVGLPPVPNQNMPFSMFHQDYSSIGYYHPGTVIWPTAPNGLMAMPQISPYFISCPVNYGWNGNTGLGMPYGGVTHPEPPLPSQGQAQIYHPVSKVSGRQTEEKIKISKPILTQEISSQECNKVRGLPPRVHSEDATNGGTVQKPNLEKAHNKGKENNNGFSLFHYGGPVALSSTLKEGKRNELSSSVQAEFDRVCSKNEANIEEYSLFASNNGFKFSF